MVVQSNIASHCEQEYKICYYLKIHRKMMKYEEKVHYVGGSSKIQTLCHMNQVLLKLRFTAMERLLGY